MLPSRFREGERTNEQLAAGFGSSTRERMDALDGMARKRLGSQVEVSARRCWDGVSEEKGWTGRIMDHHGSWIMDRGDGCKPVEVELRLVNPSSFPRRCGKLLQPASPDPEAASRKNSSPATCSPASSQRHWVWGLFVAVQTQTVLCTAPCRMQLDRGLDKPSPAFPDSRLESDRLLRRP